MTSKRAPSISVRLVVLFVLSFSFCLGSAFLFMYFEVSHSLEGSDRKVVAARWQEIAVFLQTAKDSKKMNQYLSSSEEQLENHNFMIRLTDRQGGVVFFKRAGRKLEDDPDLLHKEINLPPLEPGWHPRQAVTKDRYLDLFTDSVGGGFVLQLGRSTADRDQVLASLSTMLAATTIGFGILSVLLGLIYAQSALRPLQRMAQTIRSIEEGGDLSQRVLISGAKDELRELSETFNRMIERVEKLVLAMRQSLDDIAHDIRTPLTRIRNVAESAILTGSPEQAVPALVECVENISEISTFFDQLMEIAEAESGALPLRLERVNVNDLIQEVVELYQVVAEDKKITITTRNANVLFWVFDRVRIKRVVANLVDNALKFSPEGTAVSISANSNDARLVIEVTDEGMGIPATEIPRIWERLYRGDKSRSVKGAGLGLSVARSIVLAHGGDVSVKSSCPGGSTFSLNLPPSESAAISAENAG